MKRESVTLLIIVLVFLVGALQPGGAAAQGATWDRDDLEAFVDPIIQEHMAANHIPGAVFVLVRDGQVLLSKGYGYADLEAGVRVDPKTTVFQAMSVSKLFTATAIMQLVERGEIDLDADVNSYLTRYQVPAAFGQPVTIAHLLTHTAGLDYDDDGTFGAAAATYDDLMSLSDYLNSTDPRRVWSPGERRVYSNAAMEILGLVVEQVSGQPFADYMDAHILGPLGMGRTRFRLPHPFEADMARHYGWEDGRYVRRQTSILNLGPAATISGPGEEMAAFMIAHLQGGAFNGVRILEEATARQMQATQFTYDPHLHGQAFGFIEGYAAGRPRAIFHTGGDPGRLCSLMYLLPEEDTGFYVVQNADDGCAMIVDLRDQLIDRAYPPPPAVDVPGPPGDFAARAGQYAGTYRFNQYFHSTIQKLLILEWPDLPAVTVPGDGTLLIDYTGEPGSEPYRYVEVGPHLFAQANHLEGGGGYVRFLPDASGKVEAFSWGSEYFYEKVPWFGRIGLHRALFLFFGIAFLTAAVGSSVALLRRRRPRAALIVAALAGWLNALSLAGLVVILNLSTEQLGRIFSLQRNPWPAVALASTFLVTSVLAVVALLFSIGLWVRRTGSAPGRALYTAFALVAVAFIPFLAYWNLLGFHW